MNGYFAFSPNWCNSHPYMSIPCLTPYLGNKHNIKSLDLNQKIKEYTRSRKFIDHCYQRIQSSLPEKLVKKYQMIYEFLIGYEQEAYKTIHDLDDFLKIDKYVKASLYESELKRFIGIANGMDNKAQKCKTVDELWELIEDQDSYYLKFYEDYFENFDWKACDVFMISLAGTQQILPAFVLGRFIKNKDAGIKVIMGGNPFTKITNRIDEKWIKFFGKVFDVLSIYEGEYSLVDLLDAIEYDLDLKEVPNVICMADGKIYINKTEQRVVNIENGLAPSFEGYDLECYDSPERILPYYVTRGCYWKKCTFCDHDFGYMDCFRIKSIEKIISDIKQYKEKYQVKYIHFVDEAIPPKILGELSEAILENKLEVNWFTCIKASKLFTIDLCKKMKCAGCQFVSIGVESCSQKVLDNMDKGITIEDIKITLDNMKRAGIWAHCFMINNFEGEDDHDRWNTFFFAEANKDKFTSIGMGNFTLSRNAKIAGKIMLSEDNVEVSDFSNDLVYHCDTALKEEEADLLRTFYRNFNFTSYFMAEFMYEREHLAVWTANYAGILNNDYFNRQFLEKVKYNKTFLLTQICEDKLHVYAMLTKKYFILPKEFLDIINVFDGDVQQLLLTDQLNKFNNKEEIIYFLLEELYA